MTRFIKIHSASGSQQLVNVNSIVRIGGRDDEPAVLTLSESFSGEAVAVRTRESFADIVALIMWEGATISEFPQVAP